MMFRSSGVIAMGHFYHTFVAPTTAPSQFILGHGSTIDFGQYPFPPEVAPECGINLRH
jgi:hypothetical protein